jgi:hypothetical protein
MLCSLALSERRAGDSSSDSVLLSIGSNADLNDTLIKNPGPVPNPGEAD